MDYKRILKASVLPKGKDRVYVTVDVMAGTIDEREKERETVSLL